MPWQHRILSGELLGVLSSHSLSEIYSTLTRLPPPYRLSPEFVWNAIESDLSAFEVIALTKEEVIAVLADLASRSIGAGRFTTR